MSFIDSTCPHCGSNIKIDNDASKGFCQYCGAELIIKELLPIKIKIDKSSEVEQLEKFLTNKINNNEFGAETFQKANELLELDANSFIAHEAKALSLYETPLLSNNIGGAVFVNTSHNMFNDGMFNKLTTAFVNEVKRMSELAESVDEISDVIIATCFPFKLIEKSNIKKGYIAKNGTTANLSESRNIITLDKFLAKKLDELLDYVSNQLKQKKNIKEEQIKNLILKKIKLLQNVLLNNSVLQNEFEFLIKYLKSILGENVEIETPVIPKNDLPKLRKKFYISLIATVALIIISILGASYIDSTTEVSSSVIAIICITTCCSPVAFISSLVFAIKLILKKRK